MNVLRRVAGRPGGRWRWLPLLLAAAASLCSCSDVVVSTPTPPPTLAPTLPPIGFNHRYGNNPVAAADGFAFERTLLARKEYWEAAIGTDPAAAGYVDRGVAADVTRARAATTGVTMVLATESLITIRGFLAGGDDGQKAYCIAQVDAIRRLGYTGLTTVSMLVYFGESHLHSTLKWSTSAGYTYTVLDDDLRGGGLPSLPAGATPFASVPTALPTAAPQPTASG